MNLKQNNQVWMLERTIAYLTLYAIYFTTLVDFNEAINNVKELLEAIWIKDNEKKSATGGKILKKVETDKKLVDQAMKVSAGLYLWARKNNNVEIKAIADISKSGFDKLRDAEKVNKAKAMFNAADGKDLTGQNVTAEDILLLDTLSNEFKAGITEVSSGAAKRIGIGNSIEQMIDEAKEIVEEELDKYMQTFETSKPEFYAGYKAARVIIDRGTRHVSVAEEEEKTEASTNP